jgi:hypothetical protein
VVEAVMGLAMELVMGFEQELDLAYTFVTGCMLSSLPLESLV